MVMQRTCPHCSHLLELNDEEIAALHQDAEFPCPGCGKTILLHPEEADAAEAAAGSPAGQVHRQINRNLLILGAAAILALGGIVFVITSRMGGDETKIEQKVVNRLIENEYFQRLVEEGRTSVDDLAMFENAFPYGDGWIGISRDPLAWEEADAVAQAAAGEILTVDRTWDEGRGAVGPWLAERFPLEGAQTSWARTSDSSGMNLRAIVDAPDFWRTASDTQRRVFVHWPASERLGAHGWSWAIEPGFEAVRSFESNGLARVKDGGKWGLVDPSGRWHLEPAFDRIEAFEDREVTVVHSGNRKGLVREDGEVLLPAEFAEVEVHHADDAPFGSVAMAVGEGEERRWGLLDESGKRVAEPVWEMIQPLIHGRVPVKRDGKWGYLDAGGELVIPCDWDDAWRFGPAGTAVVTRNGKRGLIDREGGILLKPEWDGMLNLAPEGYGAVRKGGHWGLIGRDGRQVTPTIYQLDAPWTWRERALDLGWIGARSVSDEFVLLGLDGGKIRTAEPLLGFEVRVTASGLLVHLNRSDGSQVLQRPDSGEVVCRAGPGGTIQSFREAFGRKVPAAFRQRFGEAGMVVRGGPGGRSGFVNTKGEFDGAWPDRIKPLGDLLGFVEDGRWGVMELGGTLVVPPEWDDIRPFSEGLAAVRKGDLWGFVNPSGEVVIHPRWARVADFGQGVAGVSEKASHDGRSRNRWKFIDRTGEVNFELEFRQYLYSNHVQPEGPRFVANSNRSSLDARNVATGRWGSWDSTGMRVEGPAVRRSFPLAKGAWVAPRERTHSYWGRFDRFPQARSGLSDLRLGTSTLPDIDISAYDPFRGGAPFPYARPAKFGLMNTRGEVLSDPQWDGVKILSPEWVRIELNGRFGIADGSGRVVIQPEWEEIDVITTRRGPPSSPVWFRLHREGLQGLANSEGRIVVEPEWRQADILFIDTARLASDGTIDRREGERMFSPWIRVRKEGLPTIYRTDGTRALPESLGEVSYVDFYGPDHLVVRRSLGESREVWSVYEPVSGRMIDFPGAISMYWNWQSAGQGLLMAGFESDSGMEWRLMTRQGEDLGHEVFGHMGGWAFDGDRLLLRKQDGWYVMDPKGRIIGEGPWELAKEFKDGHADVQREGLWGRINREGEVVIEPEWQEFREFREGRAAVMKDEKWGFVSEEGRMIAPPVWREVRDFRNGYAAVCDGETGFWGYADSEGGSVVHPVWDRVEDFRIGSDPVAIVYFEGVQAEIGPHGKVVRDFNECRDQGQEDKEQSQRRKDGFSDRPAGWRYPINEKGRYDLGPVRYLVNRHDQALSYLRWGKPFYDDIGRGVDPFSMGLVSARTAKAKYGLIRSDGPVIAEPERLGPEDDHALDETLVVPPVFDRIAWVDSGVAVVWNDDEGTGGMIDDKGDWIFRDNDKIRVARFGTNGQRSTPSEFRHGLLAIETPPRWGFAKLNRSGNNNGSASE